jgi:uncharacterized protein (DUF1330 family)
MATPAFLLIDLPTEHANQAGLLVELAALVLSGGGELFAHAPAGRVAGLEPGTIAAGMLIAKWSDGARLRAVARERIIPVIKAAMPVEAKPLVLAAEALPDEGLPQSPDIPTIASVRRPPAEPRNAFLVIRGSAWNQTKLDQYRDVILPMHFERGAYYESFAVNPGQVEALLGEWRDGIFAISRWPSRAQAEDFWYSERYQKLAIPIRLGSGRFTVHLLESSLP